MSNTYLEVTFRNGRPFAAYYHLPRDTSDTSARCQQVEPGMVIDYTADGRPIGIEIPTPAEFSAEAFNKVLLELGFPEATDDELAPLHAA